MLGLATVPFLALILLVVCSESKPTIQLTTENSKCDGYWDRSNNHHCSSQSASVAGPSSARRQPTSPSSRNTHRASATPEDTGKLQTQKSTTPSSAAEMASQSISGSKEDFPKVGVKPQDRVVESVRNDHIAHTSELSQVLPPATSPAGEGSEQKVVQRGQERGASEGQSGELGKGGNTISGTQVPGHDSWSVALPPPADAAPGPGQKVTQGVRTVGGQPTENGEDISGLQTTHHDNSQVTRPQLSSLTSGPDKENAQEVDTSNLDGQESGESSAQGWRSAAHTSHTVVLSTALCFLCS